MVGSAQRAVQNGLAKAPFNGERVEEPFGEAVGVFTSGPYKGRSVRFTIGYSPVTTRAVLDGGVVLDKAFYVAVDIMNGEFEMREVYVMGEAALRSALREGRLIERKSLYPSLVKAGNEIEYIVVEAHRGRVESAEFKSGELSLGVKGGDVRLCLVNYEPLKLVSGATVVMDAHQPLGRALQVHVSFLPTAI